ncbi:hypothetical protein BDZ89DRAFT_1065692 [Hymenopellis radicata]|nr:hypothetical protein BDZ89DRAFT_1065692 [Hymenopellis radicata]
MDIPRTDSPIIGFDFPSSMPLTRPSPGWIRALPHCMPFTDSKPEQCDELCSEAEADLAALVHHLSFPADRHPAYCHSRSSSLDTISTIGHSPCSSALHTPSSSMDYHSLVKSRSLASLSFSPSARREAVYIVDDDDDEDFEAIGVQFPYRMVDNDEPPSRFSIDEEERPRNIRGLWTRSRVFSMSSPPTPMSTTPTPPRSPLHRVPPPIPPSPPSPATKRKSKRKTTFSMLSMFHLPTF